MGGRRNNEAAAPTAGRVEMREVEPLSPKSPKSPKRDRHSLASHRSSTAVVDISMCDLPSIAPEDLTAKQALQKLRDGCKGFEALAETLPRGADEAVKGLRARIEELQILVERAERWEKRFPKGGQLMWVQISPAAGEEEPPEWSLGQLYIAKDCLVFEANESPPWHAGPIMWDQVVKLEMLQERSDNEDVPSFRKSMTAIGVSAATPCDIRLHYKGGPYGPDSIATLRLQLSIVDMAWLERALPEGAQVVEATQSDRRKATEAWTERRNSATHEEIQQSFEIMNSLNQLSKTIVMTARDMNKNDISLEKEPVFTSILPDSSLEAIRESIVMQGWLDNYLKDKLNAIELNSTPWGTSHRLPGSYMSRTTWLMPVPEELPEDIPRLHFPDKLAITLTSRILASDTEVIISQRGSCNNLQYVDQAVVQIVMKFRFQDDCSIALNVFSAVNWQHEVQDYYVPLRGYIELTARNSAVEFGSLFAERFRGRALTMTPAMSQAKTVKVEQQPLMLTEEPLHLTGIFTKWKTDFPGGKLIPMPQRRPGFALMKICVRLTSESLSFAVVSGSRGWAWRLYPRDAVPIKIGFIKSHVSKEGMLTRGQPDAVAVALGNLEKGHGLNFHVLEKEGVVVTIWVECPATQERNELFLNADTAEGAHVWYTREDTGVNHHGGDQMDLSKYKRWLPPRDDD